MEEISSKKPIKRNAFLQPISREHHHSLLLCWKIRTGLSKGIETARIQRYAEWFFETHILPHFKLEEAHIFPILGSEHESVKKAITEHRRISRLFSKKPEAEKTLNLIEEELERHIRFEERILFNEIQQAATPAQLAMIGEWHAKKEFLENLEDEFWK